MKLSKVLVGLSALALVLTAACGKSKSESGGTTTVSGGSGLNTVTAGSPDFPNIPYSVAQTVAVTSSSRAQMTADVKALVSPFLDPQYVGEVDNVSGVVLQGNIAINKSTGDVIPGGSNYGIQVTIRDSYTGQLDGNGQTITPIQMFVPATAGRAAKGQVSIQFTDSYGSLFVNGSYTGNSFTGKLSYQNVNNGAKGDLGSFTVPTCAFFRCL